jgi:hypothetical protein
MVAVPEVTTPNSWSDSAPVVGISTGVLAGIGIPVVTVTPARARRKRQRWN